ncbi:MAG: arsenate reductase/protein-tyrosine-phosphatase family protein [Acidimicrobiales bacterium]
MNIVTLCTGNVARSVMLAYMLVTLSEQNGYAWRVRSAGTHVVEGSAMSARTKGALENVSELGAHHYSSHRSHQLTSDDVAWADVILGTEANHVRFVRQHFVGGPATTVLLSQLLAEARNGENLDECLRSFSAREPLGFYDVRDPAGGDQAVYDEVAAQLWVMAQHFARLANEDH